MRQALARQLAHPRGMTGWAVGKLMAVANRQPTRLAIDALGLVAGQKVLDLGCGGGQAMAAMLDSPGRLEVHGIDRSARMVRDCARTNAKAIAAGLASVCEGQFEALPWANATFDRILASNVMYFWHDSRTVIGELRRVLKPGGRLVIYLTAAETMRKWNFAAARTHRLFAADDVHAALVDGGFGAEEVELRHLALPAGVSGLLAIAERHA